MKRQCIKIPKKKGESVRRVLLDFELLDNSLKIGSDKSFLYLPLSREPLSHELADLSVEAGLAEFDFEPQENERLNQVAQQTQQAQHDAEKANKTAEFKR